MSLFYSIISYLKALRLSHIGYFVQFTLKQNRNWIEIFVLDNTIPDMGTLWDARSVLFLLPPCGLNSWWYVVRFSLTRWYPVKTALRHAIHCVIWNKVVSCFVFSCLFRLLFALIYQHLIAVRNKMSTVNKFCFITR